VACVDTRERACGAKNARLVIGWIHRAGVSIRPKLMSQRRRKGRKVCTRKKNLPTISSESNARSSLLVLLSAPVDNTPVFLTKFSKKKKRYYCLEVFTAIK
jgi:hypothetical protein